MGSARNVTWAACLLLVATHAARAQTAYVPLTGEERLRLYAKDALNPISLVTSAASAAFGHWRNRPEQWGQGGQAFGYRYASSYAQHLVFETLKFGSSSALHEDDRYVLSHQAGSTSRLGYAVESTFLARRDDGSRRFSYSRIGSLFGASLISRTWQPHGTSSVRSASLNFGTSLGIAAGFNVAREFLPGILHRK